MSCTTDYGGLFENKYCPDESSVLQEENIEFLQKITQYGKIGILIDTCVLLEFLRPTKAFLSKQQKGPMDFPKKVEYKKAQALFSALIGKSFIEGERYPIQTLSTMLFETARNTSYQQINNICKEPTVKIFLDRITNDSKEEKLNIFKYSIMKNMSDKFKNLMQANWFISKHKEIPVAAGDRNIFLCLYQNEKDEPENTYKGRNDNDIKLMKYSMSEKKFVASYDKHFHSKAEELQQVDLCYGVIKVYTAISHDVKKPRGKKKKHISKAQI